MVNWRVFKWRKNGELREKSGVGAAKEWRRGVGKHDGLMSIWKATRDLDKSNFH